MTDVFDPARLDAIRSRQVFDKARERGMTQTTVRALAQAIAKRLGENGADFISETDADSTIEEMIAAWLACEPTPDARAENSFHALTRKCDQHQEQWCRLCGPGVIASAIARATAATRAETIEECAKVAENNNSWPQEGEEIAAEIRALGGAR